MTACLKAYQNVKSGCSEWHFKNVTGLIGMCLVGGIQWLGFTTTSFHRILIQQRAIETDIPMTTLHMSDVSDSFIHLGLALLYALILTEPFTTEYTIQI